ncbi:LarC family nickel insertion protein [Planctomycetota bacterium]|nr:LarC family nickel insertion protein [Planctomycetota bacterium]
MPAPAVLELAAAAGAPVVGRPAGGELVTPTGAALLTALCADFGAFPSMRVERVGYGAGTRQNPPGQLPNVVRLVVGEKVGADDTTPGDVVVLEANLDDETPERLAYVTEALLAAGALDAFLTPITMKKGRPGVRVTALADAPRAGALEDVLLRESSTLGVRRRREARTVLPREVVTVGTPFGDVRVKRATRPGGRVTCAPEYEDCAAQARAASVPLSEVYLAAQRAAETLG